MNRNDKQAWISSLNSDMKATEAVFVAHYKGLSVTDMDALRGKLRETGATLKVTKNRLMRLALADTNYEKLSDLFNGATVVAYAGDPIGMAKAMNTFSKENDKLEILGGGMGSEVFDVAGVKSLALLPSFDEARAMIIGMLQAPGSKMARVLVAPGREEQAAAA